MSMEVCQQKEPKIPTQSLKIGAVISGPRTAGDNFLTLSGEARGRLVGGTRLVVVPRPNRPQFEKTTRAGTPLEPGPLAPSQTGAEGGGWGVPAERGGPGSKGGRGPGSWGSSECTGSRNENNSDHPHPPYLQKNMPPKYAIQWGSVRHKSRFKIKRFLQKIWHTEPKIWHTNPPFLCPMNRFYWGWGWSLISWKKRGNTTSRVPPTSRDPSHFPTFNLGSVLKVVACGRPASCQPRASNKLWSKRLQADFLFLRARSTTTRDGICNFGTFFWIFSSGFFPSCPGRLCNLARKPPQNAKGILHLVNPNLGSNSGIFEPRILGSNSGVEFLGPMFSNKKSPLKNPPSRNSPPKIHIKKFTPEFRKPPDVGLAPTALGGSGPPKQVEDPSLKPQPFPRPWLFVWCSRRWHLDWGGGGPQGAEVEDPPSRPTSGGTLRIFRGYFLEITSRGKK